MPSNLSIKFRVTLQINWAGPRENVSYVICEQQRRDQPAHPRSLISAFVVFCLDSTRYNISRFYSRDFKTLASFCGSAGRFVSGLVGNSRRHILSWRGSIDIFGKYQIFGYFKVSFIALWSAFCTHKTSGGVYKVYLSLVMRKRFFGSFRLGQTHTGLLSYRSQHDVWNFGYRN